MSAIQLVIFDCDGVLVDSEPLASRLLAEMLAEHGLHFTPSEILERFVGQALGQTLLTAEAMLGKALPADFADQFRTRSRALLAAEVQPVPGIKAALQALTLPYCVASSGRFEKMHTTLGATGLLPYFAERMFSAVQVASPKPAPDIFLFAAAQMGVLPEHCLVVEDSPSGIRAAIAAGMRVLAYAAHIPVPRLRDAGARHIFTDMRELPQWIERYNAPAG